MIKTGQLFVSKDFDCAVAYKLRYPLSLQGQPGWACMVYEKMAPNIYVCMRGMIPDDSGQLTELYNGEGFISGEAIERFCELKNDILLMEPLELQNAPSRN